MTGSPLRRVAAAVVILLAVEGSSATASGSVLPTQLAADDARVLTVAYRLAVANVRDCAKTAWLPGLELGMSSQYAAADRAAVRSVLGIGSRPTLSALARGGAAERAGLALGDQVVAVDGKAMPVDSPDQPASFEEVERASQLLEDGLQDGEADLSVDRGGKPLTIHLKAVRSCHSRAVVRIAKTPRAQTDGRSIELTTGLLSVTANDSELAVVIGHELAHAILDERNGPDKSRRREDQADALGLVLAARGGYDPAAGAAFWTRFADHDHLGFFRSRSHRSSSDRARLLADMARRIGDVGVEAADPLRGS